MNQTDVSVFPPVFPPVRSLVPHDGEMVLLDRVLAADAETLTAEVAIRPETLFCKPQGVDAWVGIEYMAQAIAAHAGYLASLGNEPVKVGFLLGTRRYDCSQPVFATGSVLEVQIQRVLQGDNGLGAFECAIRDQASGVSLAVATITVFQPADAKEFLQRS
ncbi:3-hydroxylacyl-ACP dehydratase [Undibacterium sp. Ji49W]|uniref:ApeP family dehydratase n=1 Tax=Undibacterium sp. Ji49W TaxID=3413040 RepID=UPI003BF0B7B7